MAKLGRHAWPKSAERALSTGQGRRMKRGSAPGNGDGARRRGAGPQSPVWSRRTTMPCSDCGEQCPKMYTPLPENRNRETDNIERYARARPATRPQPPRRARQRTRRDGAIRRGVPPLARVPPRNKEDHADAPACPAWESTVLKQGSRRLQVQLEVDPAALRLDRHTHHRNHNGMPHGSASQFPRGSWLYSWRSPGLLRGHRLDRTGQQP